MQGKPASLPNYVLTDVATTRALETALARAVTDLFGADPAASQAICRIISDKHFDQLSALLDSGRVMFGGQHDRTTRYIAPTVLADVSPDEPVMQEEIFGPMLPSLEVGHLDEAITFVLTIHPARDPRIYPHPAVTPAG